MADTEYKYIGNKPAHDKTERRILKGSSTNPEKYVDLGGTIELSEDEVKELKSQGAVLRKTDGSSDDDSGDDNTQEERGSQQQTAPGAQAPASSPDKDKRPGAQGASKQ